MFHTNAKKDFKPQICIDNIRQIGLAEHPHMTRDLLARQTRAPHSHTLPCKQHEAINVPIHYVSEVLQTSSERMAAETPHATVQGAT